jgi:hypothetical protein
LFSGHYKEEKFEKKIESEYFIEVRDINLKPEIPSYETYNVG